MINKKRRAQTADYNLRLAGSAGFTLVELLVSVALFLSVISIVSIIFVRSLQTQRNTAALIAVNDSASLSIEQISREIRTAFDFCNPSCPLTGERINFKSGRGERIEYSFENSAIRRSVGGGVSEAVTADDVQIKNAQFLVRNAAVGDGLQPRVIISLTVGSREPRLVRAGVETRIQTTISPRLLEE